MKKFILFYLLLLLCSACHDNSHIKEEGFEGYIFNIDSLYNSFIEGKVKGFNPNKDEILFTEQLINQHIEQLTKFHEYGECPVIHKNLNNYFRQYVGYINEKGEKIIWINFIWKNSFVREEISKKIISVDDGCSNYWNVKVNLSKRILFEFLVNGSA